MHVILHAAYDHRRTVESVQDAADVSVHFLTEGAVAQERPALFGREDNVQEDFGEGLRHETTIEPQAG
jgi:hypothetical protein